MCADLREFPVSRGQSISLSIESALVTADVGISTFYECTNPVVGNIAGHSATLGEYPALSYYEVDETGDGPLFVCIGNRAIGSVIFYDPPQLRVRPTTAIVPLRVFVNPGWSTPLFGVECIDHCENLFLSSFAFKYTQTGKPQCSGKREQYNIFWNLTDDSGRAIGHIFPFEMVPVSDDTPYTVLDDTSPRNTNPTYEVWSYIQDSKFSQSSQQALLKEKFEICFYSDFEVQSGIYMGSVQFRMSPNDTEGLVFFLIFLGMIFPLLCIITLLLHCFRLKRHRQFEVSLIHHYERIQLEEEMRRQP